jgi:hypothetical protein
MLRQKLQVDQITALKSGQKTKLGILRYILAQIKNKEVDKNPPAGGELNDEETLSVLKKVAKELKESIEAFEKGKRKDLADDSKKQLEIVSVYLPAEISDEELKHEVEKIIKDNQSVFDNNLPAGRQAKNAIIGICMKQLKSKADPGRIMKILQEYLTS